MSQNSFMAFAILIGFIVYITCKGELAKYMAVFTGAGGAGVTVGTASDAGSSKIGVGDLTGGALTGEDTGWTDLPDLGITPGGSGASASGGDIPFEGSGGSYLPEDGFGLGAGSGAAEIPEIEGF